METKRNNLYEIVSDKGNSRGGSVCLEGITLMAPLHILENRSFQSGQECFSDILAHKFVYAFPPFALIGRVLQKVDQDQCLMLIITPAWPLQPCFPELLEMY